MTNFLKLSFFLVLCVMFSCEKTELEHIAPATNPAEVTSTTNSINMRLDTRIASYQMMAGQNEVAGQTVVKLVEDSGQRFIEVQVMSRSGWAIGTTHIYVGSYESIPLGSNGNPQNGHFDYGRKKGENAVLRELNNSTYSSLATYRIPLSDITYDAGSADCFTILVHTETYKLSIQTDEYSSGSTYSIAREETSWANGTDFSGGNWAKYNTICLGSILNGDPNGGGNGGNNDPNGNN